MLVCQHGYLPAVDGFPSTLSPVQNSIAPGPRYLNTAGKQEKASTGLAINYVCCYLFIVVSSLFEGEKEEVVTKNIFLSLDGIFLKTEEMIQHF